MRPSWTTKTILECNVTVCPTITLHTLSNYDCNSSCTTELQYVDDWDQLLLIVFIDPGTNQDIQIKLYIRSKEMYQTLKFICFMLIDILFISWESGKIICFLFGNNDYFVIQIIYIACTVKNTREVVNKLSSKCNVAISRRRVWQFNWYAVLMPTL